MAYRVTDDLQGYLKDAVLPRLKLMHKPESMFHQGHKSRRGTLTVRRRQRNLANIVFLDSAFNELVNDCRFAVRTKLHELNPLPSAGIEEHVPNRSLCLYDEDRKTGERFTVRSSHRFNVPELRLPTASDINRHVTIYLEHELYVILLLSECVIGWTISPSKQFNEFFISCFLQRKIGVL